MPYAPFLPGANANVCAFGADNSGQTDCSKAFACAIAHAKENKLPLYIPTGIYMVSETILVPSDFRIFAEPTARIILDGERKKQKGDFLLTNDDHEAGNVNIYISGGVWDGNNQGPGNAKPDIFDENGYSGAVLNFFGVEGLHLSDMTISNSVTYNIRMSCIEHFSIENISFVSDVIAQNQDGLHFNGNIRHGVVRNIRALSKGQTNDDLIALNADEYLERVENYGMVCGEIEDVLIENVFAEDCHTVIRLLSVTSPIRNVTIRNVYGGYRCYGINLDGGRYCRTPLFDEGDYPNGIGVIENVKIENMVCRPTADKQMPAIRLETCADGLMINNFRMMHDDGVENALELKNLVDTDVTIDGVCHTFFTKEESFAANDVSNCVITKHRT